MCFKRRFLMVGERKKLRAWLTLGALAITLVILESFGSIPEYRNLDIVAAPLFIFWAATELGSSRAMEDVWAVMSAKITIFTLLVAVFFGTMSPLDSNLLYAVNASVYIPLGGFISGVLAKLVIDEDEDNVSGLGMVLRVGYGLGFGLRYGFIFGLLALGLFGFGFYCGALIGNIFTFRFWARVTAFFTKH